MTPFALPRAARALVPILRARAGLLALAAAACALVAAAAGPGSTPLHRAAVRLELRGAPGPGADAGEREIRRALREATGLAASPAFLEPLALELEPLALEPPAEHRGALPQALLRVADLIRGANRRALSDSATALARIDGDTRTEWLRRAVTVAPVPGTSGLEIRVVHPRPEAARLVADLCARRLVALVARVALRDRRATAVPDPERSRPAGGGASAAPPARRDGAGVADAAGRTALAARARRLERELPALRASLARQRSQRLAITARAGALVALARSGELDLARLPDDLPALVAPAQALREAKARQAAAREIYREKHPRMVTHADEVSRADSLLRRELRSVAGELRAEASANARRERGASRSIERRASDLAALERRLAATPADPPAPGGPLVEARAVSHPVAPMLSAGPVTLEPLPPRPGAGAGVLRLLAAGALAATALGALARGRRRRVYRPREVERLLGLPVVALLPRFHSQPPR